MTTSEGREMTDRELDAEVAERVMGFEVPGKAPCTFEEGCPIVHRPMGREWDEEHAHSVLVLPHDHGECESATGLDAEEKHFGHLTFHLEPCPFYSRDWDAMRLVVEAMRGRGWRVDMSAEREECTAMVLEVGEGNCYLRSFSEWAETLPRAVCLAALRAVGA